MFFSILSAHEKMHSDMSESTVRIIASSLHRDLLSCVLHFFYFFLLVVDLFRMPRFEF